MAQITATTVANRWPTALGLVFVAASASAVLLLDTPPHDLAPAAAAMAVLYMFAYAIDRPASVWIAFPLLVAAMVLVDLLDVDVSLSTAAVLVAAWVWALARGHLRDGWWFGLQTLGMIAFGTITVVAAWVEPTVGGVLAGSGVFLHGVWDIVHFRANKVVNRPWSEMCAVVDIPVGVLLVVVSLA